MSATTTPSFRRAGRPRKLDLVDLFLWDPKIELELSGCSFSQALGGRHPEMLALYQDMGRKRPISIERGRRVVLSALADMGLSAPLVDEWRKALDGEESSVASLGPWCVHIYAQSMKRDGQWPPKLSPLGKHVIEVEQALVEPTLAWRQGNMVRCADLLANAPALSGYLWPEVIAKLRNASDEADVTEGRCMVMLELMLSFLATRDAQLQVEGHAAESMFGDLFPNFNEDEMTAPTALFLFGWRLTVGPQATSYLTSHRYRSQLVTPTSGPLRGSSDGGKGVTYSRRSTY